MRFILLIFILLPFFSYAQVEDYKSWEKYTEVFLKYLHSEINQVTRKLNSINQDSSMNLFITNPQEYEIESPMQIMNKHYNRLKNNTIPKDIILFLENKVLNNYPYFEYIDSDYDYALQLLSFLVTGGEVEGNIAEYLTLRNIYFWKIDQYIVELTLEQQNNYLNERINQFNLYPNPASNYFSVDFEKLEGEDYTWKLLDLNGKNILEGSFTDESELLEIDISTLQEDTYIFVLFIGTDFLQSPKKVSKKVLIQR